MQKCKIKNLENYYNNFDQAALIMEKVWTSFNPTATDPQVSLWASLDPS